MCLAVNLTDDQVLTVWLVLSKYAAGSPGVLPTAESSVDSWGCMYYHVLNVITETHVLCCGNSEQKALWSQWPRRASLGILPECGGSKTCFYI